MEHSESNGNEAARIGALAPAERPKPRPPHVRLTPAALRMASDDEKSDPYVPWRDREYVGTDGS